ncbi:MAG: hypothetical protein M3P85_15885, partial [Actinomycetota bacterium]|nr:hypothetical protein [Actinomycetota bacterium]
DSGFWSNDTIVALARLDVRYTMAVRTNAKGPDAAIASIAEDERVAVARAVPAVALLDEPHLHPPDRPGERTGSTLSSPTTATTARTVAPMASETRSGAASWAERSAAWISPARSSTRR